MPGAAAPAAPAKRGRKPAGDTAPTGKATPDAVSGIVQALLYIYGQSRPGPARNAWVFSEDELTPITVPAAKILNRLGGKALNTFMFIADPVALLMGIHAVIEEGKRRENEQLIQFLNANPQAAAEYQEWLQRSGRGRTAKGSSAREAEADFPGSDGDGFGAETFGAGGPAYDLGANKR